MGTPKSSATIHLGIPIMPCLRKRGWCYTYQLPSVLPNCLACEKWWLTFILPLSCTKEPWFRRDSKHISIVPWYHHFCWLNHVKPVPWPQDHSQSHLGSGAIIALHGCDGSNPSCATGQSLHLCSVGGVGGTTKHHQFVDKVVFGWNIMKYLCRCPQNMMFA